MARGFQIDELEALPLPMRPADRLVIGRGGNLYRMDLADWRGGISERRIPAVPQSVDFPTWVNQDGAAVADLDDGLSVSHDNSNAVDSVQMRLRPLPTGALDVRLGCIRGHPVRRYLTSGLVLRESASGKLMTFGFGHPSNGGMAVCAWADHTSLVATRKAYNDERPQKQWFRVALSGSNIEFCTSPDGVNYSPFYSQAVTMDFAAPPDQWGPFINPANNATSRLPVRLDVIDWSE